MKTKYALSYLSSLFNNFEIKNNPFDYDQKYILTGSTKFLCFNVVNGSLILDDKLGHTLKNSFNVVSEDLLKKVFNEFFQEKKINFKTESIYIIDFSIFNG